MGNEAHDCEELPSVESVLGAQSGVKEFEDLGARRVRGGFRNAKRERTASTSERGIEAYLPLSHARTSLAPTDTFS